MADDTLRRAHHITLWVAAAAVAFTATVTTVSLRTHDQTRPIKVVQYYTPTTTP